MQDIAPGATATTATDLPDVPGYEVVRELGRGGMGVVYWAWQLGVNRLVALKMIKDAEFASESDRLRFRTEAEAVGRLHHPNIVPVYEVGEYRHQPYLSMEYVEGGTPRRETGRHAPAGPGRRPTGGDPGPSHPLAPRARASSTATSLRPTCS